MPILHLVSSASSQYFDDNLPGEFRTRFPVAMQFPEKSEMALLSIKYPQTWPSFSEEDGVVVVAAHNHTDETSVLYCKLQLPAVYYATAQNLVDALNKAFVDCLSKKFARAKAPFSVVPGDTSINIDTAESLLMLHKPWTETHFDVAPNGHLRLTGPAGTRLVVESRKMRVLMGLREKVTKIRDVVDEWTNLSDAVRAGLQENAFNSLFERDKESARRVIIAEGTEVYPPPPRSGAMSQLRSEFTTDTSPMNLR